MRTIAITDYSLMSPTLAKVIVSYTGEIDREFIKSELSKKMEYLATPVASSFKKIKEGVAVGFIRANKAVRSVSKQEVQAKYRVMSSNILMDNSDKSLWEVKDGAAGKYLARHGQEDLTALVQSAVSRRSDVPGLRHVTIAKAQPSELVAFVDADGDIDHGFAIATSDAQVKVLSFNRKIPMTVDYATVVSITPVSVPRKTQSEVMASLTAEQKKDAKDYYQRLYGYAPEYLAEVVKAINDGTLG
jgi:hypothetical protein